MQLLKSHRRRGITKTEVVVILGGIVAIIICCLLPTSGPHEMGERAVCSSNLRGIGVALNTYAAANNYSFPIPPHLPAVADEVGRVRYAPGRIGIRRGPATQPGLNTTTDQANSMSTTRCLWALQQAKHVVSAKSFICPESGDRPNDEANPRQFSDFRNYHEVSYGYQVPFGRKGRPRADLDANMAIMADKGPFSAALENGEAAIATVDADAHSGPSQWRRYNSPNHGGPGEGEGQNVMYPDGRVDWAATPLAGVGSGGPVSKDNIYTRWSNAIGERKSRIQGTPPIGIETPWGDTDSLIYP